MDLKKNFYESFSLLMMSLTYVTKKLEDQTLEEGELGSQKVRFFFVNFVQKMFLVLEK